MFGVNTKPLWPFPGYPRISAGFNQPRPLGSPNPTRIHGAGDIPLPIGKTIRAPESGIVLAMVNIRDSGNAGEVWPDDRMNAFPFRNYYYDMYGGIVILIGDSGKTYVFAHVFLSQVFNNLYRASQWSSVEQYAKDRFPFLSFHTKPQRVRRGTTIALSGDAGFTDGLHCHFEVHPSYRWYTYAERIDPESIDWEDRK